jgi:SM-20-related protein
VAPLLVAQLAREARDLWETGGLRHAGVGRGESGRIRPEMRTDRVKWLDPCQCTGTQRLYLSALEGLRLAINRTLFLGLFEYEGHLAVYPPGSRYLRHLDQFPGVEHRLVTCILYLNQEWSLLDGGQLRIYTDPDDESRFEEILPLEGRLVTFLSARFLHEVMPARRDRLSITGWLKKREGPFI